MSGITRDDWLTALRETEPVNDPDALTVKELAELLGISVCLAQRKVPKLVAEGKATRTKKRVVDSAGRVQVVPAYVLVKAAPARKKK